MGGEGVGIGGGGGRTKGDVPWRSDALYRSLVEQIPAVTYVEALDDEGQTEWKTLYVSPQIETLLGYPAEEWTGRADFFLHVLHPDDRGRVVAEDERTERTGEPFRMEYRLIARDGGTVWVRDEAVLVRDEDGTPLFWQGVMYDVTEQKKAEEAIRLYSQDLEREVSRRTAQLREYAERLERSNRALEDFASVASHDLQEPLRKVLTYGERLKTGYGEDLGERGLGYLRRMEDAAGRMRRLVEDLLALSRVTTQGSPFQPVDLGDVAQEVISDLEARIEETGGRVELGELPTVEADRAQMRQLLQNLVANALKFHKDGEPPIVAVRGEAFEERRKAKGTTPAADGLCRVVVEDNGIGFDEQYIGRIFTPFERLHGRNAYEGTGMGLAICRKVVERHGGEITARSAPGRGSAFTVTLPLRRAGVASG